MALYECVLIARQDITSAQVEALTETFAGIVRENGGQVPKIEQWGLKTLTYKIKKNRKGHYVYLGLDAPHAAVAEMERNMGLHEDVLRFMTVRIEKLDDAPTAMLSARSERGPRRFDDRPGGDRPERSDRGYRPSRRDGAMSDDEGALA